MTATINNTHNNEHFNVNMRKYDKYSGQYTGLAIVGGDIVEAV